MTDLEQRFTRLRDYLDRSSRGAYLLNEPLAEHTWYRIGGPADMLVFPHSADHIAEMQNICRNDGVETFILGGGANLLVSDTGFRGLVISLTRHMSGVSIAGGTVEAMAGTPLREVVYRCEQAGLGGLEGLSGIPGTVGGALIMNAGTDAGEIGSAVESVAVLGTDGTLETIRASRITFGYRSAPEIQNRLVLSCRLALGSAEPGQLRARRLELLAMRASRQPLAFPSCGSVFKRPPGHFVGRMVEELGLKGTRRGDAMISEMHGGFIVNLGCASSGDVLFLVDLIRDKVHQAYGLELETEVRMLGFGKPAPEK